MSGAGEAGGTPQVGGTPRVSVIVPTYGDWAPLATCLECLARQSVPAEAVEILVVDNNPEHAPPPGLALPGNARLIWEDRPGSYAARNAGLAQARGGILCFTDADCRPEPDWIAALLAAFEADPGVERVAGAIEIVPAGARWTIPELHDRVFGLRQSVYVERGYAATANLAVRREVFERVGPFDARLFSSGDKEWNGRASRAGSRLAYAPLAVVRHPARASFAEHAAKRERVVGGLIAIKAGPKWRRVVPPPKLLLPPVKRILRVPDLSPAERLRLSWFGWRLRFVELRARIALATGRRQARRD